MSRRRWTHTNSGSRRPSWVVVWLCFAFLVVVLSAMAIAASGDSAPVWQRAPSPTASPR